MAASNSDEIISEGAGIARDMGATLGRKVEDIADRSKAAGADTVAGVASTAEAIAQSVDGQSPAIAEYVRGAGRKIDRLASDLRDKNVGDLLTSAAEFGRAQPVLMLAGAALVGFALSRVVKAGVAAPAATPRCRPPPPPPVPTAAFRPISVRSVPMLNQPLRRPGVVTLTTAALAQTADLLQAEFRLAKVELSEKMSALRGGLIMIVLGAIFLIAALGMILQALVSVLIAAGVSPPAAILIVAGGAGLVGLVLFLVGQSRFNPAELSPDRTFNSLSRDSRMVKETLT